MIKLDFDKWQEIIISITRNKTRSFLTAFGIFWGIFMLIILIGGSKGVKESLNENYKGFATNSGFLISNPTSKAYKGFRKNRNWDLTNDDVDLIRNKIPEIETVTPNLTKWGISASYDNNKVACTLKGMYPNYYKIENAEISMGRLLNEIDIKQNRKVCVIGKKIYETLFKKNSNPCGKQICISGIYYTVIGIDNRISNMSINGRADESVNIPFTTMQHNYNFGNVVGMLSYTAKSSAKISDIQEKASRLIKEKHLVDPNDKQGTLMVNAQAMFSMLDELFQGINLLSWLVGLGTLLAGAIGVSNIMMVTVKERTTEIGIRRAIGARPIDILTQILSESIVLTIIAGIIGIFFGVMILQMIEMGSQSTGSNSSYQISFWMAIGTFFVITILGLLAGLAPAFRAMSIKPIDAIRDE